MTEENSPCDYIREVLRHVVVARAWAGMEAAEISASLGLPPDAAIRLFPTEIAEGVRLRGDVEVFPGRMRAWRLLGNAGDAKAAAIVAGICGWGPFPRLLTFAAATLEAPASERPN